MEIGSVGIPLDLVAARDFDAVFAQLAAAGHTLFMPMSIYEEVPVVKSTGYEAAFFPPPFGTAGAELYDTMRAHGIKMIVPASLFYPVGTALPLPENDPLLALIGAAGRDLIAGFYTYDEPVRNGISPGTLQAVYAHVKAIAPDLPVIQVNAPVGVGQDIGDYLADVTAAARWADQLGFSVYSSGLQSSWHVTPYSGGSVADPVTAVADYSRWIAETMPDKLRIGILQGFGIADLYSDELLAELDPAIAAAAQAPDVVTMSEFARVLGDVDTLMWFGPSYLDDSRQTAWRDMLDVSASLETLVQQGLSALDDRNPAADAISEAAKAGMATGIVLDLERDFGETRSYSVDDPRFAVKSDGTLVLEQAGTIDFETEPEVTLIASARLSDGRIATQSFVLTVTDALERFRGTSAAEEIVGTVGRDAIYGLGGDDWLWGLAGADRIEGGEGADVLLGEAGRDTLSGGSGADLLSGGAEDDRLTGGGGADMFVFREAEGFDRVADFTLGLDKIVLVGTAAPGLAVSGSSALLLFGGTEVLLQGVDPAMISLDDFFFLESL